MVFCDWFLSFSMFSRLVRVTEQFCFKMKKITTQTLYYDQSITFTIIDSVIPAQGVLYIRC